MKVFVKTFGCTFNQADSDEIKNHLEKKGLKIVDSESDADAVVFNTCGVKTATQEKILYELKTTRGKKIIVAGCLAQVTPELIAKANPNAVITGIANGEKILQAILKNTSTTKKRETGKPETEKQARKLTGENSEKPTGFQPAQPVVDGVIARTRIARGCLNACTFCQTRIARGPLQSTQFTRVIQGVANAVKQGAKEIQLTAQDCGCYGFDLRPQTTLAELIAALNEIPGDFRIRVGMLNPQHALEQLVELVDAFTLEKTYKFLHVPLQSGSDAVLKDMLRSYSVRDFKRVVEEFRKKIPEITLATDVIVGYPTETEEDFEKTLKILEETSFDVVNVSKFSPRPKTLAARLPQLNNSTIKRRSELASSLTKRIGLEKNREWIGRTCNALFTEKGKNKNNESILGRNDYYKQVIVAGGVKLGEFARVRVVGAVQGGLLAEIIEKP